MTFFKFNRAGFAGLAIVTAISISGCVSVLPEASPAAPRYSVQYLEFETATDEPSIVDWTLAIDDPVASRSIDTAKIARISDDGRVEYYSGGEWTDRAPRLLMGAMIRSFQNKGELLGVGSRSTQPIADFILQTDIRAFEARSNNGQLQVRVEIYARLGDIRGRTFAAKRFVETRPVSANTAGAVATNLNQVSEIVLRDLISWTTEQAKTVHDQKTNTAASTRKAS